MGSSKNIERRWKQHVYCLRRNIHINLRLQRAWNKHGENSFQFDIIESCDNDKLLLREQHYIDTLGAFGKNGYNRTRTASGGDNLTNHPNRKLIIEKITKTARENAKNMSEEDRKKISCRTSGEKNGNYNRRWNAKQRSEMSARQSEYWKAHDNYIKGKTIIEYFGKKRADEISKKISDYAKTRTGEKNGFYNKKHKPESLKKMRNARMGNMPTNHRSFIIDNILYESLYKAQTKLGISYSVIRYRLNSQNPKFNNYVYCD